MDSGKDVAREQLRRGPDEPRRGACGACTHVASFSERTHAEQRKFMAVRIVAGMFLLALVLPDAVAQRPAQCRQGFVWREAFPGDYVCVTPQTRTRAAQDNSQAAARRQRGGGAAGPNTCIPGYVWREARPNDHVCVTPQTRDQTAADNHAAPSRRLPP